jgi:hypothetical protein
VILSSVRTTQPGFLRSQPRMNVALTRCCKGMVVVTNKCFLQREGRSMPLGKLSSTWSQHHKACWIDWKAMLNNSVALPGLPLTLPPPIPLYGMFNPALEVQQTALYRSQQLQALARINELSRPNSIHSLSQRIAMLPRDPPTPTPMTWAQLSQASRSTLTAWANATPFEPQRGTAVTAADLVHPSVERLGGHGGTPAAAAASPREPDGAFPSLRQLVAALDQSPSPQRRGSKR